MLNEEKIKMMTKLALYEKNIGKEDFHINEYFKGDYVAINNIKTRISITIACLLMVGIYAMIHFHDILALDDSINYMALGIRFGIVYICLMISYSLVSTATYAKRYKQTQKRLHQYNKTLQQLHSRFKDDTSAKGF